MEPLPLTDMDLEFLFNQLLEGVSQQRGQQWAHNWLQNIAHRVTTERWVDWLQSFGDRLLAASTPNHKLALQMVQLGVLGCGKVGEVSREIGLQLLSSWGGGEYDRVDAKPSHLKPLSTIPNTKKLDSNTYLANEYLKLAMQYYEVGNYRAALEGFARSLTLNSSNYEAWFKRGNILALVKQFREAIACFDKVIEIQPQNCPAWLNRGNALYNLGEFTAAIASFDKAIELKPDNVSAWYSRGLALDNSGLAEEAVASFQKALLFQPDFYEAWFNRGNALDNLGRTEEASACFEKALKFKPNDNSIQN